MTDHELTLRLAATGRSRNARHFHPRLTQPLNPVWHISAPGCAHRNRHCFLQIIGREVSAAEFVQMAAVGWRQEPAQQCLLLDR
ncbi:hypothetical protein FKM82_019363 [Ascaphus truei]